VFCIYLRTNSDLCHLQHKMFGFYNRDEKCLQRGTDWSFKYSILCFVFKGLIFGGHYVFPCYFTLAFSPFFVSVKSYSESFVWRLSENRQRFLRKGYWATFLLQIMRQIKRIKFSSALKKTFIRIFSYIFLKISGRGAALQCLDEPLLITINQNSFIKQAGVEYL